MLLALLAPAHAHDEAAWPTHAADPRDWALDGDALVSPRLDDAGSRVALVATVRDDGPPLALWARGLGDVVGDWVPVVETHRDGDLRVLVADLRPDGGLSPYDGVQLRLAALDEARAELLRWEALVPRFPLAGLRSRTADEVPYASFAGPLPSELLTIGVVPRAQWGSRSTGCSSLEDDWYRMAIHHTAGDQTDGGTVVGALRTTQAYMMDSGSYCDLAYQFMMGFDGTLYEGRPYGYYSGATGNNNDGNAAACYLGCYHPVPACAVAHAATDEMIESGQLLVQTFSRLHSFPTTSNDVRGHRDWPDNATACPGDFVIDRIDEIRADLAWYTASLVDVSATALALAPGDTAEVTVTLRNDGGLTWEPGVVHLGTTGPRDAPSELADRSWPQPNRAATVPADVRRGEETELVFTVTAPDDLGTYTVELGLVADGVTWFADGPWGGGTADDLVTVTVEVTDDPPDPEPTGSTAETGDPSTSGPPPAGFVPPDRVALDQKGCGCAATPGGGWPALVLLVVLPRRRR